MKQVYDIKVADIEVDRALRNLRDAVRELQDTPASDLYVIPNVVLADGVATRVPHGLGRAPSFVKESSVRGASSAGYINETRDGVDRAKALILTATGFTTTITVDLLVL